MLLNSEMVGMVQAQAQAQVQVPAPAPAPALALAQALERVQIRVQEPDSPLNHYHLDLVVHLSHPVYQRVYQSTLLEAQGLYHCVSVAYY